MILPWRMDAGKGEGRIKGEGQAEELESRTEAHSGSAFQESADPERKQEGADENQNDDGRVLRLEKSLKHGYRQSSNGLRRAARSLSCAFLSDRRAKLLAVGQPRTAAVGFPFPL